MIELPINRNFPHYPVIPVIQSAQKLQKETDTMSRKSVIIYDGSSSNHLSKSRKFGKRMIQSILFSLP